MSLIELVDKLMKKYCSNKDGNKIKKFWLQVPYTDPVGALTERKKMSETYFQYQDQL